MKRYGKLFIIATLIVLSIGIYYIQFIFATETKPEFTILEKNGDQNLIENMTLEGYYYENNFLGMGTDLEITTKGTTYYSNQSYLSQFQDSVSGNEIMVQLQKNYRSFMRGKEPELVNFFEDDTILAYAEITTNSLSEINEDSEFSIEVLNKKTNDVLSFSVDFPGIAEYEYMYVEDVQVANNKLIVVTNGYTITEESTQDEQHVYSIDLPNEKIEKDEIVQLDLLDTKDKQIQYVELLNESTDIGSSEFLVYRIVLEDVQTAMEINEGNQTVSLPVIGLMGVNVATGEQFLIDVSDKSGNQSLENTIPIENETLYFYKKNDKTISIYAYQLDEKKLVEVESAELTEVQETALKNGVTLQVKDGIVFFVNSTNATTEDMQIMAFDSNSGDLVFEGMIEEKVNQPIKRVELNLYGVLFQ